MPHETTLIITVTVALTFAFVGGLLATQFRLPPIVAYLLVGVIVGPFTPGFIADAAVASQLAEIGVILLMFGVGIHFSLRDLLAVRDIAIPGAIVQIATATVLGMGVAYWWGWNLMSGLVLGLALSVASTVVLIRALQERNALASLHGRVTVGWLIVEDLFTVLALVLLPAVAVLAGSDNVGGLAAAVSGESLALTLALTIGKVVLFAVLMLYVGARIVPWLLVQVARTGSRELFTLGVLVMALGIAVGSAVFFGVSLALGAFLAGMVVGESDLSHQAAADALPFRDAFAVLFFVSVGMLFDPSILLTAPGHIMGVLAIIVVGKPLVAFLIVMAFGYPIRTALTAAAGLAQIGEFSFILADLSHTLGLLPDVGRHYILAGALLSITLNPFLFSVLEPIETWLRRRPKIGSVLDRRGSRRSEAPRETEVPELRGHAILCGYGRVGSIIGESLDRQGFTYIVVEQNRRRVEELRQRGVTAFYGDAANPLVLEQVGLASARALVIATPDPITARQIVEHARHVNPRLDIIVRTHSPEEREFLYQQGVREAVMGETELALEMIRHLLHRFGVDARRIQAYLQTVRVRTSVEDGEEGPERPGF